MKNQCLALSCHGHRNGQYPPEGPKLCPIALTQALYRTQSRVLRSDIYLWLVGASKLTPPPPTILCLGASCHGSRIGQDRPGKLKLGQIALPRALCKNHPRVLKSDAYFRCSGAPKMTPLTNFRHAPLSSQTRFTCHKPAQFLVN